MQVVEMRLLDLMGTDGARFEVPIYQRVYAWTARQREELLADVLHAGRARSDHFLGTMLYGPSEEGEGTAPTRDACGARKNGDGADGWDSEEITGRDGEEAKGRDNEGRVATNPAAHGERFALVDGQQRFATVTLLLTAMRDALRTLKSKATEVEGVRDASSKGLGQLDCAPEAAGDAVERDASAPGLRTPTPSIGTLKGAWRQEHAAKMLANEANRTGSVGDGASPLPSADALEAAYLRAGDAAAGASVPRLALSVADQPTLEALIASAELPEGDDRSSLLAEAYGFFRERLREPRALAEAWQGLQGLTIIAVRLEPDDRPQAVFESLNSRGMALSPADLIRNLLFVRFGYDEQKRLYQAYWEPIEKLFPDDADVSDLYLTAALHAWLEEKAPTIAVQDKSEVYSAFKAFLRCNPSIELESLLKSLHGFCAAFAADLDSKEARRHIDWVRGKREGLISERKLFGD